MAEANNEIPENAVCKGCGYRLIGLSNHRCPECGREFDPRDTDSYRTAGARSFRLFVDKPVVPSLVQAAGLIVGVVTFSLINSLILAGGRVLGGTQRR